MATVLDRILADKQIEVEHCRAQVPLDHLKRQAAGLARCRNFFQAVTKPNPRGINVIAEVKQA